MAYRIPSLRAPSAVLAGALLLGACSDTAEPEPTDFVGEWEYVVTDAEGEDATCTVDHLDLFLVREGEILTGTIVGEADDNVQCVLDGEPTTTFISGSTQVNVTAEGETSIEFSFQTLAGTWTHTGAIADNQISGIATIFVTLDGSAREMTGPFTATRR
jgi:hypothetical protein